MTIGRFQSILEVPNDQAWEKDVRFWVGRTRTTPAELSAGWAAMRLQGDCGGEGFDMSVDNDRILIADNVLMIRVTEEDMRELRPGLYDVQIVGELVGGGSRQVRGVINIVGGV